MRRLLGIVSLVGLVGCEGDPLPKNIDAPPNPTDGAPNEEMISQFPGAVQHIVPDGNDLYLALLFGDPQSKIVKIPKTGGTPFDVLTGISLGSGSQIAVNGTHVYYGHYSAMDIRRVPKQGGSTSEIVVDATGRVQTVVVDANNVYWQQAEGDNIYSATLAGMNVQSLGGGSTSHPCGLALDGTTLFGCSEDRIVVGHTDASAGTTFDVPGPNPAVALAFDASSLFISTHVDTCLDMSIYRLGKDGANPMQISTGCGASSGLVVQSGRLYAGASPYEVWSLPTAGGTKTIHAAMPRGGLAVDANFIYFTRHDNDTGITTLFRTPREG